MIIRALEVAGSLLGLTIVLVLIDYLLHRKDKHDND